MALFQLVRRGSSVVNNLHSRLQAPQFMTQNFNLHKYTKTFNGKQSLLLCVTSGQNTLMPDQVPGFQQKRYMRQEITKALTLVKDLKHLSSSPAPALTLGLSGLVPFVAMPGYMILSGAFIGGLAYSQVAYGACILSFVGAVRWGTALSDNNLVSPSWFNLGYSVAPALVAWVALMLPTSLSLITLMGGFAGAAYMDLIMFGYPAWFKALRFLLSLVAILALWTTLMCRLVLSTDGKKKQKKEDRKAVQKLVAIEPVEETLKVAADKEVKLLNELEEKELKD